VNHQSEEIENDLEINSFEVNDLISNRPAFIVRKGNSLFLIIILVLLAFSWVIKYPNIIRGTIRLSAVNYPKLVVSKVDGRVDSILVKNDQEVVDGQAMAFIHSTAKHATVYSLLNWISRVEPFVNLDSLAILKSDSLPNLSELGEIQSSFEDFQVSYKEVKNILNNGYYQVKLKTMEMDLRYLDYMEQNFKQQQYLLEKDCKLQEIEFTANEKLAADGIVTKIELNQNESKLISKKQILQILLAQEISNDLAVEAKKKEILDLQNEIATFHEKFRYSLFTLKSKIMSWIQEYVVVAPENGRVLFTSFLQQNQLVSKGQDLFYVGPNDGKYYGQMLVPQSGFGRIRPNQKVIIMIESFPSNEYGYLKGVVSYISRVATSRDSFLLKVDLLNGLTTNYGKTIEFRNGLKGETQIITDNRRLIDRFLLQIENVVRR